MFNENCKSPIFNIKLTKKSFHSISKLKSKRIILPLLHESSNGQSNFKKSLFSRKYSETNENQVVQKKVIFNSDNNSSTKPKKLKLKDKKRQSRIGIENIYNLKNKNKSNIYFSDNGEKISQKNYQRRNSSHSKLKNKNQNIIIQTEISNRQNPNTKLPLIDINLFSFNEQQKISNQIIKKTKHKFQSQKKLSLNFDFQGLDYATQTRTGEIENGKTKENNQDSSIVLKNICGINCYDIYGIMDGHGSNGHLVSDFVKNKVKEFFNNKKNYKIKTKNKDNMPKTLNTSEEIYEKLKYNNYELIKTFYKKTNDELNDTKFDVHFSGTTCILVFRLGKKIICSNVGDSRAILVERIFTFNEITNEIVNKYDIIEISHDHKPNISEERERIEKSGGEVDQEFLNENDEKSDLPFRVWKKGCDYPGLAVSRSLGDKIAEEIGVISEPEIIEKDINKQSKYIIMGSDGVFEYLSNNDIVDITKKYLNNDNLQRACSIVVEKATQLFKEKESRVDDITINIINI